MKTFDKMAAQGDMLLVRIEALPAGAVAAKAEGGRFVLAHSETGHNHTVLERPTVRLFNDAMDTFRSFLVVEDEPAELQHERSFDTHEPLLIPPGTYEVRRQREYTPEGFRRAAD